MKESKDCFSIFVGGLSGQFKTLPQNKKSFPQFYKPRPIA